MTRRSDTPRGGTPRADDAGSEGASARAEVEALAARLLDPLHVRLRRPLLVELVARVVSQQPATESFRKMDRRGKLAALALRTVHVLDGVEREAREADEAFGAFRELYFAASERARPRILEEHLRQTVLDPRALRADLAAVKRFLDFDALAERHHRAREESAALGEMAISFAGRAAEAALAGEGPEVADLPRQLTSAGRLDAALARRLSTPGRWQSRAAAADGLVRVYRCLAVRGSLSLAHPDGVRGLVAAAGAPAEHPWVRARALDVAPLLAPEECRELLTRVTTPPAGPGAPGRRDAFLIRRRAIERVPRWLQPGHAEELLRRRVAMPDPSEHVRMGLCEALATLGTPHGVLSLRALAGLDAGRPEASARVRASAAAAAARAGAGFARAGGHARLDDVTDLLARVLGTERQRLVLEVTADECAALGEALRADGDQAALDRVVPRLQKALLGVRADAAHPAAVHEAVSAAAERLERARSDERARFAAALAERARAIDPGEAAVVRFDELPGGVGAAGADLAWLGRALAELTRRDWGITAEPVRGGVRLRRGDAFRRRLWRVVHEWLNPAPNKRQAFRHTVGRVVRGTLRAPPGNLGEVTATVVPGERVLVESEGGVARHVPTVDDVLDLPVLRPDAVRVFSSYGVTRIQPPGSLWARVRNRVAVSLRYPRLAALRLAALRGAEDRERRRYVDALARDYGIACSFEPYGYATPGLEKPPASRHLEEILPHGVSAGFLGLWPALDAAVDWADRAKGYFLGLQGNSQTALAVFASALAASVFVQSHRTRRRLEDARARIPLSLGGWGTRGKSGTERLKAALFHGLGHQVLVKTTGNEAMFIHAVPGMPAEEVYIYRPYDKATIWEQAAMVQLAADLRSEVFLWECMALNPTYVRLLQHEWMRDDAVTLTNAFPDHEDIQGPAGQNVAEVITEFMPRGAPCYTTEVEFLPLFEAKARALGTRLVPVSPRAGDLLASDLQDLFPYQEHPRNISLVARMAEDFGADKWLAMGLMAEFIVPDLGVLKAYPAVRVRGRTLTFIMGMSANERTGCMNNWRRMELDKLDPVAQPGDCVVTVVNNRADRISRSEVFARIIVEDLAADRHVLIGTNLRGLLQYAEAALERFVAGLDVVAAEDLAAGADPARALSRLAVHLRRLRVPPPRAEHAMARLEAYAAGARLALTPQGRSELERVLVRWVEGSAPNGASTSVARVREELSGDEALREQFELALEPARFTELDRGEPVEVLAPATVEDLREHFLWQLARIVVHARLAEKLCALVAAAGNGGGAEVFHAEFRRAYGELYREALVVVEDPLTPGDSIIERCARAVPPGVRLTVIGIQNIKGTGLDFVYRWIALDKVTAACRALRTDEPERREAGLRELEAFKDNGLLDAGVARVLLGQLEGTALSPAQRARAERLRTRMTEVHAARAAALGRVSASSRLSRAADWVEAWVDYLDSVQRTRHSKRVLDDLVHGRIAIGRAALEMRNLYGRQKGGWLAKALARKREG